ncbi:MAG: alpha/beta hydrolase [Pseudomonadota bacterium]
MQPVDRRHVVLGGAALALGACSGRDVTVSEENTGQIVIAGGTRLHYRIIGERGPKAICIHGANGNLRDWALGPAQALAETHQVLLFDRPGFGFSERAKANGENLFVQAALMRDGARQLGFEEAVLIGHSYGGSVALAWALDAPETLSGLMLLAAPSQVWEGGLGFLNAVTGAPVIGPIASRLVPALASESFVKARVAGIFAPQEAPEGYVDQVGVEFSLRAAQIRHNAADLGALKAQIRKMVPRYPGLTLPVELLHGTADTTVPINIHSRLLVGQLPQGRLTELEGIGHMPHHVAKDAMRAALRRLS